MWSPCLRCDHLKIETTELMNVNNSKFANVQCSRKDGVDFKWSHGWDCVANFNYNTLYNLYIPFHKWSSNLFCIRSLFRTKKQLALNSIWFTFNFIVIHSEYEVSIPQNSDLLYIVVIFHEDHFREILRFSIASNCERIWSRSKRVQQTHAERVCVT